MPQRGLLSSHSHCSKTPVLGVIVQAASYLRVLPADVEGREQCIYGVLKKFASLRTSPDEGLIQFAPLPRTVFCLFLSRKIFREENVFSCCSK